MGTIEEKGNLKQQLYPHKRLQPNRSRRNQDIHILFNVQLSQITLYAYLIINGQCNSSIYEERNKEVQYTLVRNMCVCALGSERWYFSSETASQNSFSKPSSKFVFLNWSTNWNT
jgi:hypothetical protein